MLVIADVDPVAAIIALIALIVSLATLYLTALRQAAVEVDHVPSGTALHPIGHYETQPGNANHLPQVKEIQVCVFASNTGASSGVLERLEVTNFECISDEPKLWTAIGSQWVSQTGGRIVDALDLPVGFEAGDAKTLWIRATVNGAPNEGGAYAQQLRGLRGIRVTVEWTYARTRAAYWALVPKWWRPPRRQEKSQSTIAELDCSEFRTDVIWFWEHRDHHHIRLAAIATGDERERSPAS